MLPKQLRNGILHLAITGKLVKQNPNDEPASVLLEKIRAEKQKLIKEGKIKKDKNESVIFRGEDGLFYEKIGKEVKCINDEIPFEIPDSWQWVRLGRVCKSITAGGDKPLNYSKSKTSELSIPIYSNGEKNNGLFGYTNIARITEPSITVSARGTIGFSVLRNEPYTPIVRLIIIIPFKFILLGYLQKAFSLLLKKYDGVGTSIQQLTIPMITPKLIPLPPLEEQKRIAEKLDEMMPLIDIYDENYTELEKLDREFPSKMKKSILQEAIKGKLVKQNPNDEPASVLLEKIRAEKQKLIKEGKIKKDKNESVIFRTSSNDFYEKFANEEEKCINEEIPFEIPDSWEWVRLGNVLTIQSGLSYKKEYLSIKSKNMVRVLRGGNIYNESYFFKDDDIFISSEYVNENIFLKKNYLITPSVNSIENIGKIALINSDYNNVTVGGFMLMLIPILNNDILSKYLFYECSSYYHRQNCRNITNKSGQAFFNISREKLKELLIPLPPLEEQDRIVAKIEEIFKELEPLEEK